MSTNTITTETLIRILKRTLKFCLSLIEKAERGEQV